MEKIRQKRRGGTGRCDKGGQGRHCCGTMLRRRCAGRTVLLRQRDGSPCSLRAGGNCSMPEPAPARGVDSSCLLSTALRASPVMAAPAGGASSLHPMPVRPILTGSGTALLDASSRSQGPLRPCLRSKDIFRASLKGLRALPLISHSISCRGVAECSAVGDIPTVDPAFRAPQVPHQSILPLKAPVSQDPVLCLAGFMPEAGA